MKSYTHVDSIPPYTPLPPRALHPLQPLPPLPKNTPLPEIPTPRTKPAFSAPYTVTSHIVPAAYPRSIPHTPIPTLPSSSSEGPATEEAKKERVKKLKDVQNAMLRRQDEHAARQEAAFKDGKLESGEEVRLWSYINRYVRNDPVGENGRTKKQGITLFLVHCNSLPKETWEANLEHILTSQADYDIVEEVWAWEAVQHGDSALLNEGQIGGSIDWSDNTRDMLQFLLYYLPDSSSTKRLPTHLHRLPDSIAESRRKEGVKGRTISAVGHSFGGCCLARAAIEVQPLFSSLILLDPIILRPKQFHSGEVPIAAWVFNSIQRRNEWDDEETMRKSFTASPFYAKWDPLSLKLYIEHGTTLHPQPRLKMTGVQEGIIFSECRTPYDVYERLSSLREDVELFWVFPGDWEGVGGEESTRIRISLRRANSSNVRIPGTEHMIPQHAPRELGREIRKFLHRKYAGVMLEGGKL